MSSLKGFFPFLRRFSHSQKTLPGVPPVPAASPARSPCLSFPGRGAAGGLPALTLLAACGLQHQEEPEGDEPQGRHGAGTVRGCGAVRGFAVRGFAERPLLAGEEPRCARSPPSRRNEPGKLSNSLTGRLMLTPGYSNPCPGKGRA